LMLGTRFASSEKVVELNFGRHSAGGYVRFVQDEDSAIVVPTEQPSVAVLALVNFALIGHLGPPWRQSSARQFRSPQPHPRRAFLWKGDLQFTQSPANSSDCSSESPRHQVIILPAAAISRRRSSFCGSQGRLVFLAPGIIAPLAAYIQPGRPTVPQRRASPAGRGKSMAASAFRLSPGSMWQKPVGLVLPPREPPDQTQQLSQQNRDSRRLPRFVPEVPRRAVH
jgi:hypothetical protein